VVGMYVDGGVERAAPVGDARMEVRVRDGDRPNAAQGLDQRHGRGIEHGDAVPQYVPVLRAQQHRPLPDGETWPRCNAENAGLVLEPAVDVAEREPLLCGPGLSGRRDELPLVLTNRAALRGRLRWRILRATGGADEGVHLELQPQCITTELISSQRVSSLTAEGKHYVLHPGRQAGSRRLGSWLT